MNEQSEDLKHDVVLKSRKMLEMNGVLDVTSFDEHEIVILTGTSGASIDGENMKIEKFNAQNGELIVTGKINGIFYYNKDTQKKKRGLASLFK